MHEFAIVQSLVERVTDELRERGLASARCVRVRRDSTFSSEALRLSWEVLVKGTSLANAELDIEDVLVEHTCSACGRKQTITSKDLVHHLFFCPNCGQADEIEEAHGLALIEITV